MSPYVKEVTEYLVKFFVGEEYQLGSDCVLQKTSCHESSLKDYLKDRTFFRRDKDLNEVFKTDVTDKVWYLEQKNLSFLDRSNNWSSELH